MKRKLSLILSVLLILCVFAACGDNEADTDIVDGIVIEKTAPAIKFFYEKFSAARDYLRPNRVGFPAPKSALVYHGKDEPKNLRFSIKASDGYFTDADVFKETLCNRFETRDDLTTEDRFDWDFYSRDTVVIGERDYEYMDKALGEFRYGEALPEAHFKGDSVFLETVIYDGDTIIGYGVAKICAAPQIPASEIEEGMEGVIRVYMPVEIESAVFPMFDGKYQDVSEADVQKLIENAEKAGRDTVPEELGEFLKNKDL